MPFAPQPGIDIHAGKAVAGGGELALEGLAPHLPVIDHREAKFLLHSHDLADRAVLGRLEPGRRQLTPRAGVAGIAQELRPQQAPHVLNPRIHRHNPSLPHPPPRPHRGVSPWLAVQRKWRSISLAYRRPSESLFSVIHRVRVTWPVGGPSVSASPSAMARYSSPVSSVSRNAQPRTRAAAGIRAPGTRTTRDRLPMASWMKQTSS